MEGSLREYIEDIIDTEGYDLRKWLPRALAPRIAAEVGISLKAVTDILASIRKEWGIKTQKDTTIKTTGQNDLDELCMEKGFIRKNPHKEAVACRTICNFIMDKLPPGGEGMLIGTPTPICTSVHPKYHHILIDNLKVAITLQSRTRKCEIIVGNGVDPEKAKEKADWWERLLGPDENLEIYLEKVDRDAFNNRVAVMASRSTLCKVILLTSGVWACTGITKAKYDKYDLDLNFKSPAEYLTLVYPNLHILAMTMDTPHRFDVRYLNNGTNIILEPDIKPKRGSLPLSARQPSL